MTDTLRVRNMAFFAFHGLLDEEARLGQRFEVDVDLRFPLASAGTSDDPKRTVDYAQLYALVDNIVVGERRFGLVEAIAEEIARVIGETFLLVESACVRVRKPNPPVAGHFDGLEIEIERSFDRG